MQQTYNFKMEVKINLTFKKHWKYYIFCIYIIFFHGFFILKKWTTRNSQ